jgi:ribokinase
MAREAPEVAVVGSLNMDLVVSVPHHPSPGETVLGGDYFRNPGGKGANQAVAAARLGRDVAMVGRVGHDDAGQALLFSLRANDVDPTAVVLVDGAPTGIALITVDHRGENAIVVSPGANRRLTAAHVETAAGIVRDAAVTLLQLEIPMDAVIRAARLAGGVVVLNPAPAPAEPPPHELMAEVDVLVPNLGELATLAGAVQATSLEEVEAQAKSVGVGAVVVTLGSDGALVLDRQGTTHVPAPQVEAVDTTAAGDAFCGALADALVRGQGLAEAARWAVHAAAIACTRPGAQASLPTREEVEGSVADR